MADDDKRLVRRVIAYTALLALLVLAALFIDMAFGKQWASGLFGGRDWKEPHAMYYDGGVKVGNWQIVRPPIKERFIGCDVWRLEDGTTLPVTESNAWYEDGSLWYETKAYDAAGNETTFYDVDTPVTALQKADSIPLVIRREYAPSGELIREDRYVNGVYQPAGK
ncbi:MAG: hypothetical protein H6841_03650 [Planctomycetes bacterium]|nr:hypothetical protein [Planctomycetota bacterium]MCB9934215.1 hypothetical protein [Planctomycetota bacterium]